MVLLTAGLWKSGKLRHRPRPLFSLLFVTFLFTHNVPAILDHSMLIFISWYLSWKLFGWLSDLGSAHRSPPQRDFPWPSSLFGLPSQSTPYCISLSFHCGTLIVIEIGHVLYFLHSEASIFAWFTKLFSVGQVCVSHCPFAVLSSPVRPNSSLLTLGYLFVTLLSFKLCYVFIRSR